MSVAVARFLRSGGLPLAVPALIAVAFAVAAAASPSRPATTFDPATAWLVSAQGAVVRANALVAAGPAQIVDPVPADSARRSAGLLSVPGKVIVIGAGGGATIVDPGGARPVTVEGGSFAVSGARLYRLGRDTADLLTADLRTVAASRLTAVDGGVAAWDPAAGTVELIRGTEGRRTIRNAALRTDDPAATFGVTPDGSRVVKYTVSAGASSTRPTTKPATRPPTVPKQSRTTSPSPTPHHTVTSVPKPRPTPKPGPGPKPKPKPTTKAPPAPDGHGDDTLLTVNRREHTGDLPSGTVTICHAAGGSTEYWIISRVVSEGHVLWYAKTQVSGDRSGPFGFRLYADAANHGERDYIVVAARTGGARTWRRNNLDADRRQGDFDFNDLHDGIDEISARVHSAT